MHDDPAPKRRHPNLDQKRALKAATVQAFVKATGRKKRGNGFDPNDRAVDHEVEKALKMMRPEDLDILMREDED